MKFPHYIRQKDDSQWLARNLNRIETVVEGVTMIDNCNTHSWACDLPTQTALIRVVHTLAALALVLVKLRLIKERERVEEATLLNIFSNKYEWVNKKTSLV